MRAKISDIDKANTYALVHADHVLNVPLSSSGFVIADQSPYQMVIHGYINYAGEPINYTVDSQETLLKILEIRLILTSYRVMPTLPL